MSNVMLSNFGDQQHPQVSLRMNITPRICFDIRLSCFGYLPHEANWMIFARIGDTLTIAFMRVQYLYFEHSFYHPVEFYTSSFHRFHLVISSFLHLVISSFNLISRHSYHPVDFLIAPIVQEIEIRISIRHHLALKLSILLTSLVTTLPQNYIPAGDFPLYLKKAVRLIHFIITARSREAKLGASTMDVIFC
jgi:hypothetical protein